MIKTKLQAAADAASLAAVSTNSSVIATAKSMTGNGTVSGGSTYATNFFNANLAQAPENVGYTSLSPTATVTKSGTKVTSISVSAEVPTYFMGLLGTARSRSGHIDGQLCFADLYQLLYAARRFRLHEFPLKSRGAGETDSGQSRQHEGRLPHGLPVCLSFHRSGRMRAGRHKARSRPRANRPIPVQAATAKGLSFRGWAPRRCPLPPATNTTNGNSVNWNGTQVSSCPTAGTTSCIQLRADAVGYAVTTLLTTAAARDQVTNQYKVGLFPFIRICMAVPRSRPAQGRALISR